MNTGALIISLDFELIWGVRDKRTVQDYGANILGVRRAIPAILNLFQEFDIHATWATVGFLFLESSADRETMLPAVRPNYTDARLDPYTEAVGLDETEDKYHYGRSLIEMIADAQGQEIATHTFSHYYCLEPGQNKESFEHDLNAARKVADRSGVSLVSLVFPRNQVNRDYFPLCEDAGIRAYRGNERAWFYSAEAGREGRIKRLFRLADSYVPISGHNTYPIKNATGLVNLPSSGFLRPTNKRLRIAEPLKRARIINSMRYAAKHGEAFHLWWHPHNFGINLEDNLSGLRAIIVAFSKMRKRYGMRSLNMAEASRCVS